MKPLQALSAVLSATVLIAGCGGGGGGGGGSATPAPIPAPAPAPAPPAYPTIPNFTLATSLEGPSHNFTVNRSAKTLLEVPGGTYSGQVVASASGITSITLNVTNIAGVTFSETFQSADLTSSVAVPGLAPRTLLSGTKTASDGSVRALTVLDTGTAGFNYMVLGGWEYASAAGATSAAGSMFVFGPATRSAEIPTTGTATYNGLMFGRYADGAQLWTATASASATANFANRSVSLVTTNTQIVSVSTPQQAAPNLNMTGTLTYPAATNALTGALSTPGGLTGPTEARFYGPAAAELGGTFFVRDPGNTKQLTGTFGLKQ